MELKKKSRRSIGQWCRSNIDSCGQFIYNREHGQILGRNKKRWSMIESFRYFISSTTFIYLRPISGILFFLLHCFGWILLFVFSCIHDIFAIESTEVYRERWFINITRESTFTRFRFVEKMKVEIFNISFSRA